jgi:hypothetical protein
MREATLTSWRTPAAGIKYAIRSSGDDLIEADCQR